MRLICGLIVKDDICRECNIIFECPVFAYLRKTTDVELPISLIEKKNENAIGRGKLNREKLICFCKFLVDVMVRKKETERVQSQILLDVLKTKLPF